MMGRKHSVCSISLDNFSLALAAVFVQCREICLISQRVDALVHRGKGWQLYLATALSFSFSTQNQIVPSFFRAKTIGDADLA